MSKKKKKIIIIIKRKQYLAHNCSRWQFEIYIYIFFFAFHRNESWHFHVNLSAWQTSHMECQYSFLWKKKKKKKKVECRLLQILLGALTLTLLCVNSADDKLVIIFLYLLEKRIWHFMQIVSIGKIRKIVQNVVCWNFNPACKVLG